MTCDSFSRRTYSNVCELMYWMVIASKVLSLLKYIVPKKKTDIHIIPKVGLPKLVGLDANFSMPHLLVTVIPLLKDKDVGANSPWLTSK